MKPEEQIDQKQLLKMIKLLNEQFKTKIKTKGSITDLAEAFATGVESLADKALPDEVIDFFNDLFNDESAGYKDVDVAKPVMEETPLEEVEPEPLAEEEGVEELDELEPEEELPGEEEEDEPLPEEEDELEELEEEEPPPKKQPKVKKAEPKPTVKKPIEKKISKVEGDKLPQPKKETTMLEKLQSIAKKPELKAFVKDYNINIKLKNNESLQVWKAKVKKLIEGICTPAAADVVPPAPAEDPKPEPKAAPKPAKKQSVKPKAETKPQKKVVAKPKAEKPVKKAVVKSDKPKKSRGEKDAFGVTVGSLTHSFVQAIYKKPATMKILIDSGVGKHPKALKKFIAMGYMERDKAGIIQMTVKGRKVYGGGK